MSVTETLHATACYQEPYLEGTNVEFEVLSWSQAQLCEQKDGSHLGECVVCLIWPLLLASLHR